MNSSEYQVTIKSANQKVDDYMTKCKPTWTVQQLKQHISETHVNRPNPKDQRLIYAGNLLKDTHTLKQIFFRDSLCTELTNASKTDFTIHLVCSTNLLKPPYTQQPGASSAPSSSSATSTAPRVNPTASSSLPGQDNHTSTTTSSTTTTSNNQSQHTNPNVIPNVESSNSQNNSRTGADEGGANPFILPRFTAYSIPSTMTEAQLIEMTRNLFQQEGMRQQMAIFQQMATMVASQLAMNISGGNNQTTTTATSTSSNSNNDIPAFASTGTQTTNDTKTPLSRDARVTSPTGAASSVAANGSATRTTSEAGTSTSDHITVNRADVGMQTTGTTSASTGTLSAAAASTFTGATITPSAFNVHQTPNLQNVISGDVASQVAAVTSQLLAASANQRTQSPFVTVAASAGPSGSDGAPAAATGSASASTSPTVGQDGPQNIAEANANNPLNPEAENPIAADNNQLDAQAANPARGAGQVLVNQQAGALGGAEAPAMQNDVIDWVYFSIRAIVLVAALYVHASFFRLLFLFLFVGVVMFINRRSARRNAAVWPEPRVIPQENLGAPEENVRQVNENEELANRDRQAANEGLVRRRVAGAAAAGAIPNDDHEMNNMADGAVAQNRENIGTHRAAGAAVTVGEDLVPRPVRFLKLCYLVITNFLASLVPE